MTTLNESADMTFGEVPKGYRAMAVMGQSGDTKLTWDPHEPAEVDAARAQFNTLVRDKKYAAFRMGARDGVQGEQVREFDPNAERIIFVPPMKGG